MEIKCFKLNIIPIIHRENNEEKLSSLSLGSSAKHLTLARKVLKSTNKTFFLVSNV